MSDATLFESSLKALRLRMGRAIAVPSCAAWSIERSPVPTVVARLSASEFDRNLQEDRAAVPFFALCLAWWFEHFALFGAEAVKARVELDAALPETAHGHRAAFVLHELSRLVPARFTLSPALDVRWPERPVLNEGKADRDESARPERGGEHAIEVAFTRQKDLPAQFAAIDAIEAVRRQLPVGVFDGEVRRATRWSPSGKSQIDLWAPSTDGSTIHLFELKDRGNNGLGIFPESFWYRDPLQQLRRSPHRRRRQSDGRRPRCLARLDVVARSRPSPARPRRRSLAAERAQRCDARRMCLDRRAAVRDGRGARRARVVVGLALNGEPTSGFGTEPAKGCSAQRCGAGAT